MKGNEVLVNSSQEVGDTWVVNDLGQNLSLAHCDLQEQLDKSASGTGLAFILFTGNFPRRINKKKPSYFW